MIGCRRAIVRRALYGRYKWKTILYGFMKTNKIYVAIGKEVEERESVLRWVLKTFPGKTVCVLYVHVPAKRMLLPSGLELPVRLVRKDELEAFRAREKEKVLRLLDDCSQMCAAFQVHCENTFVEKDSIIEGILELIYQLRIQNLVMGGAANNKYWRGITKLMSEKAKNVLQSAPAFCTIWFICNDHLICKREGEMQQSPTGQEVPSNISEITNQSDSGIFLSQVSVTKLGNSEHSDCEKAPAKSYSDLQSSSVRIHVSKAKSDYSLPVSPFAKEDVTEQNAEFSDLSESFDQHLGNNVNNKLYNKQAIPGDGSLWREAFRKSVRSWNAEKQAMQAIRKAKPVERLYYEELKLKKAMKEEAENMKRMLAKVSLELSEALDNKSLVEKDNFRVKELMERLSYEKELSYTYKNECDKLQIEWDNALGEAQMLREQLDHERSRSILPTFLEFSYVELQNATKDFDPFLKIGEGSYGSMYKGFLHHTDVAIKLLAPDTLQNREFDEQVAYRSKLQHPNLVTLIGACREPKALVYEYLPGGSLQLTSSPPLPWQMRIRIAVDICRALIFLHSSQSAHIVCCNLTPSKLLLDANFTCKITDCGVVAKDMISMDSITTRVFNGSIDSDFEWLQTGLVTLESDVYSFGVVLLYLLTGKQGLAEEVKGALSIGSLDTLVDPFAGDWPFVQAEQLAHLSLRCCDSNINNRPDLASDVWRVLAPMQTSCSSLPSMVSHDQPPHYFVCPILQETMEDPHFAADGFTYEAEAIRGWFESGHDSSPMTNVQLSDLTLTPNRALRSAIQEWLQLTSTK